MLPPATTVAGPDLTIDKSADPVTAVVAVEELFAALGSAVALDTDAVFDSVPACAGAVTTTVMVGAVAPVAKTGRVHVTETFPVLVHVQPVPDADTKVTPAGNVSVTDTPAASDGPLSTTTSE
jgi:hypothetical protein